MNTKSEGQNLQINLYFYSFCLKTGVQIKFDSTKGVGEISKHMYMHLYFFYSHFARNCNIFICSISRNLSCLDSFWEIFKLRLAFCIKSLKYTCASHFRSKHMVLFCRSFLRKMQVGRNF